MHDDYPHPYDFMMNEHERDKLAAALRTAILDDLVKIEIPHRQRAAECRKMFKHSKADDEEALANIVRVAMVTAQAAVNRVLADPPFTSGRDAYDRTGT